MERGPNGDADDDTICSDAMMSPMSSEAREKIALKENQKSKEKSALSFSTRSVKQPCGLLPSGRYYRSD